MDLVTDLSPVFGWSILLAVMCFLGWFGRKIFARPPKTWPLWLRSWAWLLAVDPSEKHYGAGRLVMFPATGISAPAATIHRSEPSGLNEEFRWTVIPGCECPWKAEGLARGIRARWRTNKFAEKICEDFEPTPLPEFLQKNFADKNHRNTERVMFRIYDRRA